MTTRAIILDFDGVVVESEPVKDELFRELFALYPAQYVAAMRFHESDRSLPRRRKFEHLVFDLLGWRDDPELVTSLVAEFSALAIERLVSCPLVPGARELLEHFAGRVPLYVASVTPRDDLVEILRRRGLIAGLTKVFGDPPTTKAEAVRQVLRSTGAPPADVVLVGDSASDRRVAAAAGIRFVGRHAPGARPPGPLCFPDLFGALALLATDER